MFRFLKSHPFAVEAFFESSIVLTFAIPKELIQSLIPECLEPDILNGEWAFIAVALVQAKGLRPKGFPKIFGKDFFLAGYRVFVRYTNSAGKKLRGLYILKSETDKKLMEILGNIFTQYCYTTIDIKQTQNDNIIEIISAKSGLKIIIEKSEEEIMLPFGSPFCDWSEARRFAGPLPYTFTYYPESKKVLIVEGVRENWKPIPVKINNYNIPFLNAADLHSTLANAFIINHIPYYWKKGKIEQWNG